MPLLVSSWNNRVNEIAMFSSADGGAAPPRRFSPGTMTISLTDRFLVLLILLFASSVYGGGPTILFDNQHRPESGIPPEARAQERTNSVGPPSHVSLFPLLRDSVKALRVQYFNKESWKTEDQVRAYLGALTTNRFAEVYGFQVWSELVGTPEIDCLVDFSEDVPTQGRFAGTQHLSSGQAPVVAHRSLLPGRNREMVVRECF